MARPPEETCCRGSESCGADADDPRGGSAAAPPTVHRRAPVPLPPPPADPGSRLDPELAATSLRVPMLLLGCTILIGDAVLIGGPGEPLLTHDLTPVPWFIPAALRLAEDPDLALSLLWCERGSITRAAIKAPPPPTGGGFLRKRIDRLLTRYYTSRTKPGGEVL